MLKLLALVLFALSVEAQIFPVRAPRWFSSSTAPSSGCTVDADTDKIYIYKQAATTTDYRCRKTGASTFAWVDIASASGATGDVQGGTNLTSVGAITYISASSTLNQDTAITRVDAGIMGMTKLRTGTVYPASDSTTAVQVTKADASTAVMTVDTTNSRVGIGTTPTVTLDVKGLARFYDATASTGVTTVTVQAGAGQSSTDLQQWKNNAGTTTANVTSSGELGAAALYTLTTSASSGFQFGKYASGLGLGSTTPFYWTATNQTAAADTSLSRIGPGIVGVGTGPAGSVAGTVQATKYQLAGSTSSFPMLDNSSATLRARLADASGYAVFDAASFLLSGTTKILSGTGSPEGLVTAPVGSIFLRTDGAAGYESYYKGSGSGNTGWSARGNGDYYYPVSYSATPIFQAVAGVGTTFAMTLTGNVTSSTIADASEGKTLTWRICQDATGGRTFAWPTNVVGASTIDSTASACTTQIFVYDGTNAVALTGATVVGGSGANYVLIPGSTSGTLKIQAPAVAGSSVLTFPAGTTDLSATGPGYLKQASAGAAVTVQQIYRVCDMAIGDTAGSALSNAQLGPQKRMCFIPQAATVVEINVAADGGTPNVIVGKRSGGTATDLLSAALATAAAGGIACSKTSAVTCLDGATTASATLQNTSLAAGDYLELVSGTAGGTAKLMTVHVVYTIN